MSETLRTLFMGISTLVAVFSFYNTVRLWQKSNRPILSALVETDTSGSVATTYNLVIINSGNRPAINIQLKLKLSIEDFKQCITQDFNNPLIQSILKCFSNEMMIPLLINGDKISNCFGLTSSQPESNIWQYESLLPIEITYQDLEGNQYTSALTLVVKDSKTFAGTEWSKEVDKKDDIVKLLKQILNSIK